MSKVAKTSVPKIFRWHYFYSWSCKLKNLYSRHPSDCVENSLVYSLINSIDFHPIENIFCATFSNRGTLIIYRIDDNGKAILLQRIFGHKTKLSTPQHAMFTPDGERLIVINWSGESFGVYCRLPNGNYSDIPTLVIKFPEELAGYKPHGMDITRCGSIIVASFGNTKSKPRALASFGFEKSTNRIQLLSVMEQDQLPGIPKGVCLSPDQDRLLVTFSDINRVCIYSFNITSGLIGVLDQRYQTLLSNLNRPEEIRLTHERDGFIVSNSGGNSVATYRFSEGGDRFIDPNPDLIIGPPQCYIRFPHGISISPDGNFLVISQFGPLHETSDGDILFSRMTPTRQAKLWVFKRTYKTGWKERTRPWPWTPLLWQCRDRIWKRS